MEHTHTEYQPPELVVLGNVETLTLEGNDPCRFNEPRGTNKQTGTADLILGQAALTTCSA